MHSSEIANAMLGHDGEEQAIPVDSHPVRAAGRQAPVRSQVEACLVRAVVDHEQQLALPDLLEVLA
ncbi:hypothetical protein D3C80_2243360 [compost metagenome]